MSITLSGRLLDDVGQGINGATVQAIPVGSGTPDASTTTAAHPSTGENGWWTFSSLDEAKVYKVSVEWQGKKRQFYGLSCVQYNRLTIGKAAFVVTDVGDVTLKNPVLPGGLSVDSPSITLVGKHGADPGTEKKISLINDVANDGTYSARLRDNSDATLLEVKSTGEVRATGNVFGAGKQLATTDPATTGAAGLMSAADKSKLDGIESGATADMSAAEILAAVKSVDGAGSGLDADKLDGNEASAFATANHDHSGTRVDSAAKLKSDDGTKWAYTTNTGFTHFGGGTGGIKKIKWLTGLSGTGAHAHGLGETPNVVLPITRGPTAYASVGYNWADATNIYINSSQSGNEFSCLVMVVENT